MALRGMFLHQQVLLLGLIILAATAASQLNFGLRKELWIYVLNISLDGEMRVSTFVAHDCYNESKLLDSELRSLGKEYTTGCISLCNSVDSVVNGSCSGIGCCQTSIPEGVTDFYVNVTSFNAHWDVLDFNPCGFGFVVEEEAYNFSSLDFENFQNRETVPVVLDWAVGSETCPNAQRNSISYACIAANSECYNSTNGPGYRCNCSSGFQGNPYLLDGCQDIDECKTSNPCIKKCNNFPGGFNCSCPKGYEGDGKKIGTGCRATVSQSRTITIALSTIFSAEELKKATNNYDKARVLGQGGYGTVYRGELPNKKVVAIKKSKICDHSQIEQFINEIILLTQIIHKNVVKLLGCCLETEVPLLVYEFITNGTLSHHIHDKDLSSRLSWEKRLKIAAETAGALAYMHSETFVPIIHRDVKTANILLDDNFTAKVADFGASRLVPLDQTQLTTLVQGTFGYLDPEFLHTSQLTEKSDVYSFGVVMAELLTGRMALSFDMPENDRNLAMYFAAAVKEDRLLQILDDHILKEGNIEQLKEVANLAQRCLKVRGEDRPSMKEVALELEGLVIMEKHLGETLMSIQKTLSICLVHLFNHSALMLAPALLPVQQLGTIA
uniref:Protein kinase domain-containing protein n=1 Tax=Fagus sylvatica TaxID=28930 RepID=A0A2N9HSL5_FAGSY